MQSNLYIATLIVDKNKGIATISAYSEDQAKELANEYWQGVEEYNGEITISQVEDMACICGVKSSLKVLCGNTLEEVLNMNNENLEEKEIYILGDYTFDIIRQTLTYKDGTVENLTTKENDLLQILVKFPNKLVDRDSILEKIWTESNYYTSRSMDVYITKLRKHFIKDNRIELINVHGKGFKFVIPN